MSKYIIYSIFSNKQVMIKCQKHIEKEANMTLGMKIIDEQTAIKLLNELDVKKK